VTLKKNRSALAPALTVGIVVPIDLRLPRIGGHLC
jgi:hypothetical protein